LNFFSLFKRKTIFFFKKKINIDNNKFNKCIKLDDLFIYYKTDKSTKVHGFSKFYTKHLNKFKNKKINILEIGSAKGGSAASFVHYFKKSSVFCIDVNLTLVKYKSKKINFFGLHSSNIRMLNKFLQTVQKKFLIKKFDLIIDDGSHLLSDQLFSLNYFYKNLNKGGFYIIEDYRFPNYFSRCKNVKESTIDVLIKKLKKNKRIKSKILENSTTHDLYKAKIYPYKGNTKISDIVFFNKK
tara:strand:+ start:589 stop:1308 length:720 start_codon:yes stop_codon:yes gene_type:complete